ncbi:hypothetical protein GCM10010873_00440 [Cypionkella aquatica]|uniref:PhnA-like protein n=1 Tax=Cypionkella aquatica TaxID=1756042 RepID=A0AA37X133_9RHOB|nr:hypothetical protein [Cypionkella aquatica]GLS85071.1 hypothetical protein GCM10010873_00440 [Cypionkella aquatica]
MENTAQTTNAAAPARLLEGSYVDWAAIFAGAVVAIAIGILLTGFGSALGLSTLSAEPGEGSAKFGLIISAVWIFLTIIAAYATGGYVAGRMRRRVDNAAAPEVAIHDAVNGVVVWAVGTLVGAVLLTNVVTGTLGAAGNVAAAAGSAAGTVVQATGTAVGGVAQGALAAAGAAVPDSVKADPMGYINDSLLRPQVVNPGSADTASVAAHSAAIMANVAATGAISDQDKAYLVSAVAAQTQLSAPEAAARVDETVAAAVKLREDTAAAIETAKVEAQKLADDAKATAIAAAETARKTAILSAFALAASSLLAAVAAYIGAVRGGRHRDEGKISGLFSYKG